MRMDGDGASGMSDCQSEALDHLRAVLADCDFFLHLAEETDSLYDQHGEPFLRHRPPCPMAP